MHGPERDQTETREAIKELTTFVENYPRSELLAEGQARLREARDRLSQSEYRVGYFYWRSRWYPGRDRSLQGDPGQTIRSSRTGTRCTSTWPTRWSRFSVPAEALPFYERLIEGIRDEASTWPKRPSASEALKAQLAQGARPRRASASGYSRGRVGRLDGVVRFDDGATATPPAVRPVPGWRSALRAAGQHVVEAHGSSRRPSPPPSATATHSAILPSTKNCCR